MSRQLNDQYYDDYMRRFQRGQASGFNSAMIGRMAQLAAMQPRASGGPVKAGQPYLVNEKGAEGFVRRDGSVRSIDSRGPAVMLAQENGWVLPHSALNRLHGRGRKKSKR